MSNKKNIERTSDVLNWELLNSLAVAEIYENWNTQLYGYYMADFWSKCDRYQAFIIIT